MTVSPSAQADLARSLAAISGRLATARAADVAGDIERLRRAAVGAGLLPVAAVAHAIGSVLADTTGRPQIDGWLAILADAIACGRSDPAACETFSALCSVRLSG